MHYSVIPSGEFLHYSVIPSEVEESCGSERDGLITAVLRGTKVHTRTRATCSARLS